VGVECEDDTEFLSGFLDELLQVWVLTEVINERPS